MKEKLAITMAQQVCSEPEVCVDTFKSTLGRDLRKMYFDLEKMQAELRQTAQGVAPSNMRHSLNTLQERVAILKVDLLEVIQNARFED